MKRRRKKSLSQAAQQAMSSLEEAVKMCPSLVPGLSHIQDLLSASDEVGRNQEQLRALANRVLSLANLFANLVGDGSLPPGGNILNSDVNSFLKLLGDMSVYVNDVRGPLSLSRVREDQEALSSLNGRLDAAVAKLTLVSSLLAAVETTGSKGVNQDLAGQIIIAVTFHIDQSLARQRQYDDERYSKLCKFLVLTSVGFFGIERMRGASNRF